MGSYVGPSDWWSDGTNKGRTHIATKGVVQSGLILNLDAGVESSYPGSGTTWFDLSGNGNNAILTNGPTYIGSNGGYFSFDGTNDYLSFSGITLNTNTGFTIDMWIYVVNPQTIYDNFWAYWYSDNRFEFGSYGTGSFIFKDDGAAGGPTLSSNTGVGKWGHILFGCNSTVPFLYSNGVSSGTSGNFRNTNLSITNLMRRQSDGSRNYKIYQSSIKIYNRVLTLKEIQQNFNATKSRFGL